MPRATGYIVQKNADPGSPWVFSFSLPEHAQGRIGMVLPSPMQEGVPIVQGMPILSGSIMAIIQPGNTETYGIIEIDFPEGALSHGQKTKEPKPVDHGPGGPEAV